MNSDEAKRNLLKAMLLAAMKLDKRLAVENAALYQEMYPDDYEATLKELVNSAPRPVSS